MLTILTSEFTLEFAINMLPIILPTIGFTIQLYLRIKFIDKVSSVDYYLCFLILNI